ncbi:pentapeptide repeat-containing protein [Flavobacterium johnsoniae]|uniref:pentapeptide repeat-containing protein n=1 Tax=Flavobacterium johnsoniae TaxID=986 RepID=UPI0011EC1AEB|nr:pentapeptide repeat-containing protein [Flavobacterium johnsoniae]
MKKLTKKYLRERWKSNDFISSFPFSIDYKMNVELLNGTDLQGITNIGCGEPFWKFPKLSYAQIKNINFSFGNGSITIFNSHAESLIFEDFKFDRSSMIFKSIIKNSTFKNTKLTFDISDTTFENCDFSNSKFTGGFEEYGFRRCKFINCKFTSAFWKNTYILASWFIDCQFKDFKIVNSSIKGFKVNNLNQEVKSIFENCSVVNGLIEIGTS